MKTFVFTLFLNLALFAACNIYAANTTLNTQFPASVGYYNQIVLQNLQAQPDCTQAVNTGVVFMDFTLNQFVICSGGQTVPIPYPETCFNRFCSNGSTTTCPDPDKNFNQGLAFNNGNYQNPCPAGFAQIFNGGIPVVDQVTVDAPIVYSTVCCNYAANVTTPVCQGCQ